MRFFTADLLRRMSASPGPDVQAAITEWAAATSRYQELIERDRATLPRVLLATQLQGLTLERVELDALTGQLIVVATNGAHAVSVNHIEVSEIEICVGPRGDVGTSPSNFGAIAANEILVEGEGLRRHAILLDSGGSVQCTFKDVVVSTLKRS